MSILRSFIPTVLTALSAVVVFTSCDDEASTLGSSLVTDESEIVIDSTYVVTGRSVVNKVIQSRTLTQLIGRLDAREFGNYRSEVVTQFMSVLNLDTAGVTPERIDSVHLTLFSQPGKFTGDSLVPMGMEVHRLTRQLPSPIYSDFDPSSYYDEAVWSTQIYTANASYNDSLNSLGYRSVSVPLPVEWGREVFRRYKSDPATFATPQAFTQFFPGIYIKNTFGSGRVLNINEARINFFYHAVQKVEKNNVMVDTTYYRVRTYMAVTPEVISNNIITTQVGQQLIDRIDGGEAIIVAPSGYDVEVLFPVKEVIKSYNERKGKLSVINTLTFTVPVEEISNDYDINPPANVLLVLKKDRAAFFAENKINNDETSFIGVYDPTNKCYSFNGMRPYLLKVMGQTTITEDDYLFVLTPVDVLSESNNSYYGQQSFTTAVNPFVSGVSMAKINLDKAKIKFTFSNQSVNF